MIRCGYRGYAEEGNLATDSCFIENIEGAINNGISVGVYFFSQALNEEEAIEEAIYTLGLIKNYSIKYPVVYDFEIPYTYYRGNAIADNKEQTSKNAEAYLDYIKSQGYTACLYGNSTDLKNFYTDDLKSSYPVWVANFTTSSSPSYTGDYVMWQCSGQCTTSGISGVVDLDVDYAYFNKDITDYLFDATYYADRYADLKKVYGYDSSKLLSHYEKYGKSEGRNKIL